MIRLFTPFLRRLPIVLMVWGLAVAAFLGGYFVSELHWYPDASLDNARLAATVLWTKLGQDRIAFFQGWSDVPYADAIKRQIVHFGADGGRSAYLVTGGPWQFMEYCPENGCAAVIVDRDGRLVHAYPFRPDELVARRTVDLPYDQVLHDDMKDTGIIGLAALPDGDLIAVYDFEDSAPYGGGVSRIDKDGHIVWYRRDYSNHWPTIVNGNEILVISNVIGPKHVVARAGRHAGVTLDCPGGIQLDVIRVLDEHGQIKENIPLFQALLTSSYAAYLRKGDPTDPCDPLHANSVNPVGSGLAARLGDVAPEDLLISLRNIDALVVMGRADHKVKHLFKGTFGAQHSAQISANGDIILFDNWGSSPEGGPSRVLQFDPLTGEERTIFPNRSTPKNLPTFTQIMGNIDLSDDGATALVSVWQTGRSYEIRIADGELLTSFDNLHDVHTIPSPGQGAKFAARIGQTGIYYVAPQMVAALSETERP